MKTQLIVTHPGSAHFDEVTAIGLILSACAEIEFRIERREPSPAELEDSDTWVVDIGNRHEPKKHNFDHHQSLDCPAAFVLVAEYLGLVETMSVMPWWYFKDEIDRFGPVKSSVKYHAGDDLVNRNPVESWLHFLISLSGSHRPILLASRSRISLSVISSVNLLKGTFSPYDRRSDHTCRWNGNPADGCDC